MNTAIGLAEALKCLPHGPEFRFIDSLVELRPGEAAVGQYAVRADDFFLRGHFPDQPLLPGVLMIEACAQLAGIVAQTDPLNSPLRGLKLSGVRSVKIFGTAKPGETLRLTACVTGRLGNLIQANVTAELNGLAILEGSLTLSGASS